VRNNLKEPIALENKIVFALFFALFVYLVLRAVYTPILHDEVATFYYYIQTGVFFPPEAHWDANNHILNSLLSNWSYKLFGSEPWALRLPNLLSFVLYFFASWHVVSRIKTLAQKWLVFLTLVMCHYVFEYFGETRGYGLSMAFLMLSFSSFLKAYYTFKIRYVWIALCSLFLALSANLTMIYLYLMMLCVSLVFVAMSNQSKRRKIVFFVQWVVFSVLTIAPAVWFSLELKERGALYYGGKSSFIHYTVNTLSDLILGSNHLLVVSLLIALFFLLLFIWLSGIIRNYKLLFDFSEKSLFALLLMGSVFAIFSTRYLLDVNFPEDRAAMYLFPLFVLSLAYSKFNKVCFDRYFLLFKRVAFSVIPFLFLTKIDIYQASFSMEERAPTSFFEILEKAGKTMDFKPTVGGYHTQNLCWYYMNYQSGGEQNSMVYSTFPDTICDFQILNQKVQLPRNYLANYKKLNDYPQNGLNMYQRKVPLSRELLAFRDGIHSANQITEEYFGFLEIRVDSLEKPKALLAEIEGVLLAEPIPFEACIVISQKDKDWNEISQERVVLNWLRKDWKDDQARFKQVLLLPHLSENATFIQVFVWNMKQKVFTVKQAEIRLFGLN
jgi:hypothetical protein